MKKKLLLGFKIMGGLFVLLIALSFVQIYVQNATVPELGVTNGRFSPLKDSPNGVSTQTNQTEKRVATFSYKGSSESTINAIKEAIAAFGGAEIITEEAHYLYVVFTTPLMQYNDDVEFWLDEENQVVHFRSQSRAGQGDMGLNRSRYDALLTAYENNSSN